MALEAAREMVEQAPDDPDGFAALGTALSRVGAYPDAWVSFQFALGSTLYEIEGIGAHADVLRAFGQGHEAASLRLQRPLVVTSAKAELLASEGAIDDLRSAGDLVPAPGHQADDEAHPRLVRPEGRSKTSRWAPWCSTPGPAFVASVRSRRMVLSSLWEQDAPESGGHRAASYGADPRRPVPRQPFGLARAHLRAWVARRPYLRCPRAAQPIRPGVEHQAG